MTATNHVATGALAAAYIANPFVVIPLAFVLHFVLDALPHFGYHKDRTKAFGLLKYILIVDSLMAASLLAAILLRQPIHWQLIIAGGIVCASPDLLQIPRYVRYLRTGNTEPLGDWLSQFHSKIQRYERPWGIWVEFAWLAFALSALWRVLG